jgi:hypothetical protein
MPGKGSPVEAMRAENEESRDRDLPERQLLQMETILLGNVFSFHRLPYEK